MSFAVLCAIGANIGFSLSSIAFTSFSKQISVVWMNYFKATVCFICFLFFTLYMNELYLPSNHTTGLLMASGFIGLCVGDMFLFKSFTMLGPGRTLILFSFHPLFTGIGSYFLFDQKLNPQQFLAIFIMIGCLVVLGREGLDKNKKWQVGPLLFALFAIALDASGVVLTRMAFESDPFLTSGLANLIRAVTCVAAFSLWGSYRPIHLVKSFTALRGNLKVLILAGSILGTFISLLLYMKAIKHGHLATISAIAACGPIWASFFEFVFYKQKPSKHLFATFGLFAIGMVLLNSN